MYSGFRITFNGAGACQFDNDSARNVIIFVIDNYSRSNLWYSWKFWIKREKVNY